MNLLPTMDLGKLKQLNQSEIEQLCREIRQYVISCVSASGGHLASNLGAVELTVALHRAFDSPEDKLVWDVGHQAYVHKLLTGRREELKQLRCEDGISGFPKPAESEHDSFGAGHASTAISAALGMARARDIKGESHNVVAVVGDASMTGGMSMEAINDAGRSRFPFIVVLNDNNMSISQNVGAFAAHLDKTRSGSRYNRAKERTLRRLEKFPELTKRIRSFKRRIKYLLLPSVLFEEFGFTYYGPVDGHDVLLMERYFRQAAALNRPVLIHVVTQKGKGYVPAQEHPELFHGADPFDELTGRPLNGKSRSNSAAAGEALQRLARKDESIVAITAAMTQGTGLQGFRAEFPERFFDVGIAEQHAVTMAAGMASAGLRPFVAIYSTFLQRAYDQILHDVCLQGLPVVIGVDRCGLVGEDGATHQGVYDISYLMDMPGLRIYSPRTQKELEEMLALAFTKGPLGQGSSPPGPVAIRYPKLPLPMGEQVEGNLDAWERIGDLHSVMLVGTGYMVEPALKAAKLLEEQGVACGVISARTLKPMDEEALAAMEGCELICTVEDGVATRGLGAALALRYSGKTPKVLALGLPEQPVEQGRAIKQYAQLGLDGAGIARSVLGALHRG